MKVETFTDIDALAEIEPAWWDLWRRVPTATPFAAPAWLLPWWRSFEPGRLLTVALFAGGELAGLAPLYVEDGRLGRRLLPLGIGIGDMLDVLIDPARADEVAPQLAAAVAKNAADLDCWSAEEAPPGAAVLAIPDPGGWRSTVQQQSSCPCLALPPGRKLRDVIPPSQYRKIRAARNRMARRDGSLAAASAETLGRDLAELFRLHGLRWTSRGEAGVLDDQRVRRFHDASAPALLEAGLLRLTVMRLDGVAAGACYCLCHGAASSAYIAGFDPAYAFESPGTLLFGDAITEAAERGATSFSFLRGREPYKYDWGALDRWNQRRLFEPLR